MASGNKKSSSSSALSWDANVDPLVTTSARPEWMVKAVVILLMKERNICTMLTVKKVTYEKFSVKMFI